MLNLIRRWFNNRNRAIFRFWDGQRIRRIDPLLAYRRLDTHPEFDWSTHPEMIDGDDERLSSEATEITARAVCEVFGVRPFDGSRGLTEQECIGLLIQFVQYLTALKKNGNTSPTSVPSTESQPPADSESRENSDSTSTFTA
jgi:hypothetical protein